MLASFANEKFVVSATYNGNVGGLGIQAYTHSDLTFEYGKSVETQGTTGGKPISYITAVNLIKGGFKIHLDHRYVNVASKIYAWRKYAESRNAYVFSIGGSLVSDNKFVVTSVKVSNTFFTNKGKILRADLDISIEEYAGSGSKMSVLTKRLADYE